VPLFDPSFGIPLKYLNEMLNNIFNKRIIIGHDLPQLIEILKLKQSNVVYTTRDLKELPELRNKKSCDIASTFFDADIDEHFKSTITEARLWYALYKNF